jgi:hypothetical protein
MATNATTPAEITKARDFETERAAIRAKLAESKDEKVSRDLNQELKEVDADEENSKRTGVGVRVRVGQTRGKSPLVITWEAFDESKPETLPTKIPQFMEVTGVKDEPTLVAYLIGGYNDANYTAASDPLAEFVELTWKDDVQTQFRLVVRNYSRGANVSLEDAVALIKPGFVKQFGPAAQ